MILFEREIRYYKTKDGKEPFRDWFKKLRDIKAKNVIDARLARIRMGNYGAYKTLGSNFYEIKIHYGPGYRLYFTEVNQKIILLLLGGNKTTQSKDIQKAQNYLNDLKGQKNE